jgi:hypothetical protein
MFSPENSTFEQYLFNLDIKRKRLNLRLRQEQRFVKGISGHSFSQRSRAFISAQIPLIANTDFSKGVFSTIQNEIFLNTQHKEKVNNSVFDQNRAFISIGYRWSKKIDTEIGYLRQLQRENEGDLSTNVCQFVVTTTF